MKTKVSILAIAMLMGAAVSVSAQSATQGAAKSAAQSGVINVPTPEQMAQKETQQMTKDLGLNASQQKQIQAINLKYADQRWVKRVDVTAEGVNKLSDQQKAQLKTDAQASIAAQEAEFKTVLTDKQYQTYLKNKQAAKAKLDARLGQR